MNLLNDEEYHKRFEAVVTARNSMLEYIRSQAHAVDPSYSFNTVSGTVSLNDLFGDASDLLLIHNMGKGCNYCTLWADCINGLSDQITRRTAVTIVNGDAPDVQAEFAAGRGWKLPMAQDADKRFTQDMGFGMEKDGKYFRMPGVSAFHKDENGTITRTGADGFGPGDMYMPTFQLFDLLKDKTADWQPK